jgi:hypothetical protein
MTAAIPGYALRQLSPDMLVCNHADSVTVLDQSVLAIIDVCRSCHAMCDDGKWIPPPTVEFWRRGDVYDLLVVVDHHSSLPTHPVRWT